MVQSFQSLMLMSSSNTRAQNTVTFKSFTKAYCLLLDATDIWEYKYKWHPRPHSDDAILPKSNADDGLPPHWRERRLKIYHACPSPTSPHTKLSSCCINSNWNKKLMVLLEFLVKEINIHCDQHDHHWAGCTIGRVQTCWVGGDTHGPML